MPDGGWTTLGDFANNLTVIAVLVAFIYLVVISDKLQTTKHSEDVTRAQKEGHDAEVQALKEGHAAEVRAIEARNTDLLGERDRAVTRENEARRELAENTQVMGRLDSTVREALQALARRR